MLLIDEPLATPLTIDATELSGHIVPVRSGSVAIVGREQPVDAAVEKQIVASVSWEA